MTVRLMKLNAIAYIRSGLVLSRKTAQSSLPLHYPLLTLRSVHPKGYIEPDKLEIFSADNALNPDYLSQTGDIIVRLSAPYTAILLRPDTQGIVISSNFVRIQPDSRKLSPGYLFWLLNTPAVRRRIYQDATSNMLGAVKASWFANFDVPSLSLDQQNQIAALNELTREEVRILNRLADEKEKYYHYLIQKFHDSITGKDGLR